MLLQWVVSVCPVTIPMSLPVFLRVKAPFLPCFLLQLSARRSALHPASRPPFLRTLVSVSEAAYELTPKSHLATNIRSAPPSQPTLTTAYMFICSGPSKKNKKQGGFDVNFLSLCNKLITDLFTVNNSNLLSHKLQAN